MSKLVQFKNLSCFGHTDALYKMNQVIDIIKRPGDCMRYTQNGALYKSDENNNFKCIPHDTKTEPIILWTNEPEEVEITPKTRYIVREINHPIYTKTWEFYFIYSSKF